jgi:hypothetical protein
VPPRRGGLKSISMEHEKKMEERVVEVSYGGVRVNGLAVFLSMSGFVVRMSRNCGEFMKVFGMQEDWGSYWLN